MWNVSWASIFVAYDECRYVWIMDDWDYSWLWLWLCLTGKERHGSAPYGDDILGAIRVETYFYWSDTGRYGRGAAGNDPQVLWMTRTVYVDCLLNDIMWLLVNFSIWYHVNTMNYGYEYDMEILYELFLQLQIACLDCMYEYMYRYIISILCVVVVG